MARFPDEDIMTLVGASPTHELAESVGPDLRLGDLFSQDLSAAIAPLVLGYGTAQGDPALRAAIAKLHGVGAEAVITTVGGVHALFLLALVLCEPGEEAVLVSPMFPMAKNALAASGAVLRSVPLCFDDGYQLDARELAAKLSPGTRVVSLASPQNPSGVAMDIDVLRQVMSAMHETCPQATLVVDETYREAVYGEVEPRQSAAFLGPRVVVLSSLSKCHGAPGLRLGWLVVQDVELRRRLLVAKFNTVISCSPVDEALSLRLLQQHDRIMKTRRDALRAGRQITAEWVDAHSALVEWVAPDAGALCCIRLRTDVFSEPDVERFHTLLQANEVRVARGTWFGDEARVFRLGFGFLPGQQLRQALQALSRALVQAASS